MHRVLSNLVYRLPKEKRPTCCFYATIQLPDGAWSVEFTPIAEFEKGEVPASVLGFARMLNPEAPITLSNPSLFKLCYGPTVVGELHIGVEPSDPLVGRFFMTS